MNELDLAKSAFVAAHGRFLDAHSSHDLALSYAALGETIWWIVALDEHYRHHYGRRYERFRDASEYGRQIPGIRYARNLVGHQIALLLEDPIDNHPLVERIMSGDLISIEQMTWRRLENLPVPTTEQRRQEQCYRDYLAGYASRYALRRANYFFVRQRDGLNAAMTRQSG
jgi:hypothetical protein